MWTEAVKHALEVGQRRVEADEQDEEDEDCPDGPPSTCVKCRARVHAVVWRAFDTGDQSIKLKPSKREAWVYEQYKTVEERRAAIEADAKSEETAVRCFLRNHGLEQLYEEGMTVARADAIVNRASLPDTIAVFREVTFSTGNGMTATYAGHMLQADDGEFWCHGDGKMVYDNGAVYNGKWELNERNGHGTLLSGGTKYVGNWEGNKQNGEGMMTYWDDDEHVNAKYEGVWRDGMRHGYGKLTTPTRGTYHGAWEYNHRHGLGRMSSPDGSTYTGHWKNDKRTGWGECIYPEERHRYTGDWREDNYHGNGRLGSYDPEGRSGETEAETEAATESFSYNGQFFNGKFHGHGKSRNIAGRTVFEGVSILAHGKERAHVGAAPEETYEGQFFEGNRHGFGDWTHKDGSSYTGMWKDGDPYGKGKWFSSGLKEVHEGHFRGSFSSSFRDRGKGKVTYRDGSVYIGDWQERKRHGCGVFKYADGSVYTGQFASDKKHGNGKMTFVDGGSFLGSYKEDKRDGRGTLTTSDGTVRAGVWKKGRVKQWLEQPSLPTSPSSASTASSVSSPSELSSTTTEELAWRKRWHAALAWVLSTHRQQWKIDRAERMATALNRVASRKREIIRERADAEAKARADKEAAEVALRGWVRAAAADGRVNRAEAAPTVSAAAKRMAKKKIAREEHREKLLVAHEEKLKREKLMREQQAKQDASLEVARKIVLSMRADPTDPRSGE